jgi:hypothetical protein
MITAEDVNTDHYLCYHCKETLVGNSYYVAMQEVHPKKWRVPISLRYGNHSNVTMISFCEACWKSTAGEQYCFDLKDRL